MQWVFLCPLADLIEGEARGLREPDAKRDYGFVIRRGEQVFAWRNDCPHVGYQGTSMAWKKDEYLTQDRTHVLCAGHGARFEITTGRGVSDPCKGLELTPVSTKITPDGQLFWLLQSGE